MIYIVEDAEGFYRGKYKTRDEAEKKGRLFGWFDIVEVTDDEAKEYTIVGEKTTGNTVLFTHTI